MKIDSKEATWRADLGALYVAAVAAGDPERLTAASLRAGAVEFAGAPSLLVAGAGKAAAKMARAVERELAGRRLHGLVIAAEAPPFDLERIAVEAARHPLPDERGERATARLLARLDDHPGMPLLFLLSGGASSLLVQPRPPVTLGEKVAVTDLLLRSGADIQAMNTVRKHLSLVKGGGLLRRAGPRPVVALMLSDVVGNDPSVIGSGPTAADPTTYADAEAVLRDLNLWDRVPDSVRAVIEDGLAGRLPETLKDGDPELSDCANIVIGDNRTALEGAAAAARRRGFEVAVEVEPLTGDTVEAARAWLRRVADIAAGVRRDRPWCVISGGETTVRVRGRGRGGRNQEFALALVEPLRECQCVVLSAGTDGIDGPTDAAGALVSGSSARRAQEKGLDPHAALADNDSYTFFSELGDSYRSGATGTNLMDVKIAVGLGPLPSRGTRPRGAPPAAR